MVSIDIAVLLMVLIIYGIKVNLREYVEAYNRRTDLMFPKKEEPKFQDVLSPHLPNPNKES